MSDITDSFAYLIHTLKHKEKMDFKIGKTVTVYDRYLFAVPVRGTITNVSDKDGAYQVKLFSNVQAWQNIKKFSGGYFHHQQCRIDEEPAPKAPTLKVAKRKVIMVDLEDTLSDSSHRIKVKKFGDLDIWNPQLKDDKVRLEIAELVAALSVGYDIIISTAKPMRYTKIANEWMAKNIPFNIHRTLGRPEENMMSSPELKADHLRVVLEDGYEVALVIDDRADVCKMYKDKGYPVLWVPRPGKSYNKGSKKVQKKKVIKTPDQILKSAAGLFKSKNDEYGAGYKQLGDILFSLFPDGLALNSKDDFCRWATYTMILAKVNRYAQNFEGGGHEDSLVDLMVNSSMLIELDQIRKANNPNDLEKNKATLL